MPNPLYTCILNIYMIWFGWVLWYINHCWLFNAKPSLYIYIKYIWFGLVGFYGISIIVGYSMPNPLYTCILNIYMIWFGWVLWYINHCWLFNAKPSLYIYIKYIWFGLVGFYGISIIVGYSMPNPLYTCILNIYMIWFGWVLWYINHCWLFNAKPSLYIYIKYIWFGLFGFYGISIIVGYSMPNPLYTCILNIYMIWFGWVLWYINHCWLFNAKPSLYIYILNIYDLVWLGFMAYQSL